MSPKIKGILLLYPCFFLNFFFLSAQKDLYIFRNIKVSDGLGNNTVTGIVQDNKGFIWISTGNGLQKYDGNTFTAYHHDPADPQSINSDNCTVLFKDRQDSLWLSTTFWGFNRFGPSTGKSIRVADFEDSSRRSLDYSTGACMDPQGNIWLISINSIAKYDMSKHRLISFDYLLPKSRTIGMTKSILCDPRTGNLWINSYAYGICMLDPKRNILCYYANNPDHNPLFDLLRDPGTMYLDRENNLWINTYSGRLYRYNLGTGRFKQYSLPGHPGDSAKNKEIFIDCMMQDRQGTIWMGARRNGLLQYSPSSDSFRLIYRTGNLPGGLDYDIGIICLFEDREGNIWVGSEKGVFIFNPYRQQFRSISLPSLPGGAVSNSAVMNFLQTRDNDLWVATYGQGIQVYDDHLRYKTAYTYQSPGRARIDDPGSRVWCLLSQADGRIFAGCQHGWIAIFDPKTGSFTNVQPAGLGKITIFNMTSDSSGNVWFALYDGIAKWDCRKNFFIRAPEPLTLRGNTEKQVFDVLIDKDQNVWVATQTDGLQKLDPSSGAFTKIFVPDRKNPGSISDNSIQCIIKINDSLFALGTASGGINLFNPYSEQFTYITAKDGLPSNNVTALYFQAPQDLWAACSQGLCKVDLARKRVFNYGLEDGIVNNEFGDCLRFYKTRDGRLLLGYEGGFVSFRPDSLGSKEPPANVTVTAFKIFEQSLVVDSLLDKSDTIHLSYKQNFVHIEFASLNYLEPQRINYYYQLQGVDKGWVYAGRQRLATYANLAPGTYLFQVRSENRDGIPCAKITTLYLVIRPPFWQTWWFKSLLGAVLALLLYIFYRYRINQLMKWQAMRNEISKDLHDDLGASLSSISILSEVAKDKMETGDQDQTQSLLNKISGHSQEMVEKMSDIVWAINPKNENVEKIIQRLSHFGQGTCESKDIQLEIESDEATRKRVLPMEAVKNIYLIVKEAMNNAIKHADCRRLSVSFRSASSGLEISVLDDGSGFDPQSVKSGNGLLNMESRVNEMNGSILIRPEKRGTRVALKIPIT